MCTKSPVCCLPPAKAGGGGGLCSPLVEIPPCQGYLDISYL